MQPASWRCIAYASTKIGVFKAFVKLLTAQALIFFGGCAPHEALLATARVRRLPVVVVWTGTDVTDARENFARIWQAQQADFIHVAAAPGLVTELKHLGIDACCVPITVDASAADTLAIQTFLDDQLAAHPAAYPGVRHVVITGLDTFATDVARLNNKLQTGWRARVLNFRSRYEMLGSLRSYLTSDALYVIGAPALNRPLRVLSLLRRKPTIMHWVGYDIGYARRNPSVLADVRRRSARHLTEVEWEVAELGALGIEAKIAPLPPRVIPVQAVPPLPDEFTLLTYLLDTRPDFYGRKALEFLMHALRNEPVRFLVVGGGRFEAPPYARVENLGWCASLGEVYGRSSALLRFTPSDGLSLMVLEALAYGRHVLWTKEFPYVRTIRSMGAALASIQQLIELNRTGNLQPQMDAAEFVRTRYDRQRCLADIKQSWDMAVAPGPKGSVPIINLLRRLMKQNFNGGLKQDNEVQV